MKIVILLLYNESDNRQEQKVNMISSLWREREREREKEITPSQKYA